MVKYFFLWKILISRKEKEHRSVFHFYKKKKKGGKNLTAASFQKKKHKVSVSHLPDFFFSFLTETLKLSPKNKVFRETSTEVKAKFPGENQF